MWQHSRPRRGLDGHLESMSNHVAVAFAPAILNIVVDGVIISRCELECGEVGIAQSARGIEKALSDLQIFEIV